MGLTARKKSGNIIGGSRLVVPGQPIYSVKVNDPSFNSKGDKSNGQLPNTTINTDKK
jgi:hypothetical protein